MFVIHGCHNPFTYGKVLLLLDSSALQILHLMKAEMGRFSVCCFI